MGIRSVGFSQDAGGPVAEVEIFPLTEAAQDQIRELCHPYRATITEGSEELPRRC